MVASASSNICEAHGSLISSILFEPYCTTAECSFGCDHHRAIDGETEACESESRATSIPVGNVFTMPRSLSVTHQDTDADINWLTLLKARDVVA